MDLDIEDDTLELEAEGYYRLVASYLALISTQSRQSSIRPQSSSSSLPRSC